MLETTTKIIKNKVGLINLAKELGNISKACKIMGFSRDTFYRYQSAVEEGGVEALIDRSRRAPNFKNRVPESTENAIVNLATDEPAWGQARVSNHLRNKGITISAGGVRSIWLRNDLETFKKRLKALEEKVAKEGIILTESQLAAMEKKKLENEAHGEIETEHPGYLGAQDTFFIGTLKGVGRLYQQTFIDTFAKVGFCKIYNTKTPITAADLLNDKVLPFFDSHNMALSRVLTDRGTEYCGKIDRHEYQLFLAVNDIDHTKTKARHPQTNGIVERFHKTVLQEFYQVAFRKKIYKGIEELQQDLDAWLKDYNENRPHQGKMCCGRTPMQTFLESKDLYFKKQIQHGLSGHNSSLSTIERSVKDLPAERAESPLQASKEWI